MDSAAIKLELMQQLMSIADDKILQKVASFFRKEVATEEDGGITDEEIAEFDRQHAAYMNGELKGISGRESVRRLRKAQARDEAV